MFDQVSNYPKDCSSRNSFVLQPKARRRCVRLMGRNMKAGSREIHFSTFFGPISFWALPLMEKGSPVPRKWTKKILKSSADPWHVVVIDFGSVGTMPFYLRKGGRSREGQTSSPTCWGSLSSEEDTSSSTRFSSANLLEICNFQFNVVYFRRHLF